MIPIEVDDNTGSIPDSLMPRGNEINRFFLGTFPEALLELAHPHSATMYRLEYTRFHYEIMDYTYGSGSKAPYTRRDFVVRAEMNAILFNLFAALHSLLQEINVIYNCGIDYKQLKLGHVHDRYGINRCLLCRLQNNNSQLQTHLETTFSSSWFTDLREYRNMAAHRLLTIIMVHVPSMIIYLPNTPYLNGNSASDYSARVEIQSSCKSVIDNVIKVVERSYELMFTDAKNWELPNRVI